MLNPLATAASRNDSSRIFSISSAVRSPAGSAPSACDRVSASTTFFRYPSYRPLKRLHAIRHPPTQFSHAGHSAALRRPSMAINHGKNGRPNHRTITPSAMKAGYPARYTSGGCRKRRRCLTILRKAAASILNKRSYETVSPSWAARVNSPILRSSSPETIIQSHKPVKLKSSAGTDVTFSRLLRRISVGVAPKAADGATSAWRYPRSSSSVL